MHLASLGVITHYDFLPSLRTSYNLNTFFDVIQLFCFFLYMYSTMIHYQIYCYAPGCQLISTDKLLLKMIWFHCRSQSSGSLASSQARKASNISLHYAARKVHPVDTASMFKSMEFTYYNDTPDTQSRHSDSSSTISDKSSNLNKFYVWSCYGKITTRNIYLKHRSCIDNCIVQDDGNKEG